MWRKPQEPEDEGWLITFADMSVLLMSFFILMFAVSTPDPKKFEEISKSLRESGFYHTQMLHLDPAADLKKELALALSQGGFDAFTAVASTDQGVSLEIAASSLFASGSAQLLPGALPLLELAAKQLLPLASKDIRLEVEGHTDDSPIQSELYPSNWELSAARAANLVRYFAAQGFPTEKLRVVGYGDTQPKAPNRDAAGNVLPANQQLNRRVVVQLIRGEDL